MSDKNKIQIAVTIVLGVVLIALAVGKFSLPSPQELTPTAAARIALQPNANEPDLSGPLYLVLHQATKDLAFSRDPFNPLPVVPVDGPVKINLMGIVWDPQKPTAIINNEIVQIGSVIAEHVVIDIQENKVIVNDGSSDIELTIPKF
ncbi:MAG: hypothetical protein A2787_07475 [Omnitrophica WOR_2 bacterium RIFCSPHIGHO2_01_FULL_48_9]|uniref:Uncharacterized protein n=1 Tax=Candidatus Sungbacteria bacterium RIFCSPHIGHO2_02_FULL_47_11 TaxID=1802270 RepID=A0A1G2KKL8_9BACT|nr:MAG: hypothetical protein A2787_07475 [Omnitrophica WOR_2 bacterium RIFCSPHIGHO2_01_FULL_48_9]OGZ99996.1 MAG: hypothetical protein A3C07_04130 [Candidatus Sungbacteria bacterium RIFCSPHIGHO2_02_FULL_47_11]